LEKELLIYIDGKYYPKSKAKVSVYDHGLLYGDGVFEGIRAYDGIVFKLKEHVDRLYDSARVIMLDIPLTKEDTIEAVLETLRKNELRDAYIRLVVTRGVGDLGLDPRKCPEATVVIIASAIQLYPEELYETGLKVITVPTRRNGPEMVNPRIKSLNYLNNIMARIEANLADAPEAIMLNSDGYVAECTGDNIFIIDGNTIYTPPKYAGILKGTKREIVLEISEEMGLEVKEELFTRHDVFNADECFLSGTAAEVIPVVEVDGRSIGDGSVGSKTTELIKRFREIANSSGREIYE